MRLDASAVSVRSVVFLWGMFCSERGLNPHPFKLILPFAGSNLTLDSSLPRRIQSKMQCSSVNPKGTSELPAVASVLSSQWLFPGYLSERIASASPVDSHHPRLRAFRHNARRHGPRMDHIYPRTLEALNDQQCSGCCKTRIKERPLSRSCRFKAALLICLHVGSDPITESDSWSSNL